MKYLLIIVLIICTSHQPEKGTFKKVDYMQYSTPSEVCNFVSREGANVIDMVHDKDFGYTVFYWSKY